MVALAAIDLARERGVTLSAEGDRIMARPSGAITPELRAAINTQKAELLDLLNSESPPTITDPTQPCPACSSGQWWQLPGQPCHCRGCKPDMPPTASTLTLPCHEPPAQPAAAHAGLDHLLEIACEGLSLTPEELRQELTKGGGIPDLQSGALTPKALRLTARTLALMRYAYPNTDIGFLYP